MLPNCNQLQEGKLNAPTGAQFRKLACVLAAILTYQGKWGGESTRHLQGYRIWWRHWPCGPPCQHLEMNSPMRWKGPQEQGWAPACDISGQPDLPVIESRLAA